MSVRALAIAAVLLGISSRGDAAPCKPMVRPTSHLAIGSDDYAWLDRDHDVTIRVLSTAPFLFQTADPGTRERARWSELAISPATVDDKLAALPFGAVVRVHYRAPPIMNSVPPPHLTALAPGPTPAAEPALVAEWDAARGEGQIQILARQYRQHGEIYAVWQTEAIPPPRLASVSGAGVYIVGGRTFARLAMRAVPRPYQIVTATGADGMPFAITSRVEAPSSVAGFGSNSVETCTPPVWMPIVE